jgi:hypothetical protein
MQDSPTYLFLCLCGVADQSTAAMIPTLTIKQHPPLIHRRHRKILILIIREEDNNKGRAIFNGKIGSYIIE